jgi:hypothetical protein
MASVVKEDEVAVVDAAATVDVVAGDVYKNDVCDASNVFYACVFSFFESAH